MSLHMSKCHIVGNLMHWLNYVKLDEQGNIYKFPLKNCVYLDYGVYSMHEQ